MLKYLRIKENDVFATYFQMVQKITIIKYVNIYIYVWVYIYIYIHTHIYIERERERENVAKSE